jgi:DNA (cytosine-5)-methyltransferase 1
MRCVEDLLPKVFVLENVHGISYSGKEEGFRLLERVTAQINRKYGTDYQLIWRVINAADYGIPQLRQRFFLVAHREGKKFEFPAPTHAQPDEDDGLLLRCDSSSLRPYITAWDAIGQIDVDLEEDLRIRGQWADLLPSIPEGENYLWHTNRKGGLPLFGWRTRYWSFLLKLAKTRPSWTIQAHPGPAIGPFHWRNRLLSAEEMARLQTFPAGISLIGSRYSIQQQIGNAVPSLLAEALARAIATQFFGVSYKTPLRLAITPQRPIPPPESVSSVPCKYLGLVGDHPDHPGEGRGKSLRKHQGRSGR